MSTEPAAAQVAGFGVKVTLVEPGPYATDWAGSSAIHAAQIAAYEPVRKALAARQMPAEVFGEPGAVGPAILALVDAEKPPLRFFLGVLPTMLVPSAYQARLTEWESWKDVAVAATKVQK